MVIEAENLFPSASVKFARVSKNYKHESESQQIITLCAYYVYYYYYYTSRTASTLTNTAEPI